MHGRTGSYEVQQIALQSHESALHERIATDIWRASEYSDSRMPATITMDKNEPTPEAPRPSDVAFSQQEAVLQNTTLFVGLENGFLWTRCMAAGPIQAS